MCDWCVAEEETDSYPETDVGRLERIEEAYQKCNRDEITLLEFFQQAGEILNQEPAKQ